LYVYRESEENQCYSSILAANKTKSRTTPGESLEMVDNDLYGGRD